MKLLLAEDETDLAEALAAFLERNKYTVDVVGDGEEAYYSATGAEYDAIILDIMMPKRDGIQVLKQLRAEGNTTPIMMLTARGEKTDRITGFDAGADDYLPKPFDTDELLSRLRAILRRKGEIKSNVLAFGDLTMDCDAGTVASHGKTERLRGKEFQLMELFMHSPRMLFSADRIMERVWSWESDAEINVVWVHISNLRKKLEGIGSNVTIKASRGLGYMLEELHDQEA